MAETLDLRLASMRCGECHQRFGADAMFCPFDGSKLVEQAWDPSGDPLMGKLIDGRYEVTGVLGEGGMGTVYKVRHATLDRGFALKILRRDLARDADLAARFTREARATASVKHPNVVAINDFGQHEGVPYFVMELLGGQTLARAIKTGGAIPAAIAVRIALKIAAGIGAAHDEKIVHRDLKPDNVFVLGNASPGQGGAGDVDVRIVDFGAAMIIGASRVTKTGVVFGTPHYMSPEQASGQPVDHRADIYALGVILYEMFTGKVPFEADTYMGVLTQHMFVKPVPPSQVSEAAKELGALEQVTLRALEKKPEHRYASMHELAADIERVASFSADGSMQVAPSIERAPGLAHPEPAFVAASALETPGRDEAPAVVTRTSTRRRRARARAGALYGSVVLGVATVTLVILRLTQPRGDALPEEGLGTSPVAATPTTAEPAPPPSATIEIPPAIPAATPSVAASATPLTEAPVAPTPRPASRPSPRPAPAKKPPPAAVGDFKDPWTH